jgi:uncharacterized membrane protein (DUF485 family)
LETTMLHEPAAPTEHDPAASFKARLGVWMFACYSLFYAGFVVINLYKPLWMEVQVLLGMNLATVYGFALIVVALAMALVYNAICGRRERALAGQPQEGVAK